MPIKKSIPHSRFIRRGLNAGNSVKNKKLKKGTNSRGGVSRFDMFFIEKEKEHLKLLIDEFEELNLPATRTKLINLYKKEHNMLWELVNEKNKTKTEQRIVDELKKLIDEKLILDKK